MFDPSQTAFVGVDRNSYANAPILQRSASAPAIAEHVIFIL